nr:unnamed protein product [Callosobruchus analis]
MSKLIAQAPVLAGRLLAEAKPRFATFMKYAKVELAPPTPADIPQIRAGIGSDKLNKLINIINHECEMAFPEKSKMVARHDNRNQIHWFTEEIRQYREYLHFLTRINSSNSNLVNNSELQKSRNIYRDLINKAKKEANDSYIKTANNKQKAIWDVIKSNSSIKSNNNQHQLSANDFNDHFVQIASNIISQILISSAKNGSWKNLTVKEAWLNTLVGIEVWCWFYVGECIGKRHIVGYKV